MARARRGANKPVADSAEVAVNAGTPGMTAGGESVDESKRGSRAVHSNPTEGATMSTGGTPGGLTDRVMKEGAFDGEEKPAKVVVPSSNELPAKAKKWVVERGGMIVANGARTRMAEGKVVDDLNFDIRKLKSQGIKLREATEDDAIL